MDLVAVHVPILIQISKDHVVPEGCEGVQEESDQFAAQLFATLLQLVPQETVDEMYAHIGIRIIGVGGVGIDDQPAGPVRDEAFRWKSQVKGWREQL